MRSLSATATPISSPRSVTRKFLSSPMSSGGVSTPAAQSLKETPRSFRHTSADRQGGYRCYLQSTPRPQMCGRRGRHFLKPMNNDNQESNHDYGSFRYLLYPSTEQLAR